MFGMFRAFFLGFPRKSVNFSQDSPKKCKFFSGFPRKCVNFLQDSTEKV